MALRDRMADVMARKNGMIAALDQSGGSTPKALTAYGIGEDRWSTEEEMFDLIHEMRTRIITSPAFNGDKVIGAILFVETMDRAIDGIPTAQYLWERRGVVPFLKVDQGLDALANGVRLMKTIDGLDALCSRAVQKDVYGTKMRSVIDAANPDGISAIVAQQFDVGRQIIGHGLMPILEPEITITIPDKAAAETLLKGALLRELDGLPGGEKVMLKLSLPSAPDFYRELIDHPKVVRVVALSGGYPLDEAVSILAENPGMIASFSRALIEGLSAGQDDDDFDGILSRTIDRIHAASLPADVN